MPEDTRPPSIQLRQQAAFFWTLKLIPEEISTGLPWMQLIEGSSRRGGDGGHWELITNHWDPPNHIVKLDGFGVRHTAS
jgi:hypothetical protein